MPTPLDLLRDPISITVFILYAILILVEALFPARRLPHSPWWRVRGLSAFMVFFFISSYLPLVWGETLIQWQLFDLTWLGTGVGALVGLLVYEAGVYVWHRAMHRHNFLWKYFHQMHHSAERLDTYGALWFSPLDMLGWTLLNSLCLTVIIGITPEATVIVLYITMFLSVFQHSNLRTPRWLGYIVQRPESHSYHHGRGIHSHNYSDLPMFDLLFDTFVNPKEFIADNGFYNGASLRLGDLLLGRDVTKPKEPTTSQLITE